MKTRRQRENCHTVTRRSKRSKKTSENEKEDSLPLLPMDLILKIFSKLPTKSIGMFRCVSKFLASIILRPYFTDLFLAKSSERPQILFACRKNDEAFLFSSQQPQNPDENSSPLAANLLKRFTDKYGSFIIQVGGLVGLVDKRVSKKSTTTKHLLYNPTTGRSLPLPKVRTMRKWVFSKFGYDPVENQFKTLSMTKGCSTCRGCVNYKVLTLGTQKPQWRMIECGVPHRPFFGKGICINGVLYYPATHMETCVMVCFDVRYEKFSFFDVTYAYARRLYIGSLIVYNDKLALLQSDVSENYLDKNSTSIELIVIGDFEKQEWSKHTYVLPPSWKTTVGECFLSSITFVGVTRTNEIVLLSSCYGPEPFYLFYYNMERSTFTRVEINGLNVDYISHIFLDHVEDLKFIGG